MASEKYTQSSEANPRTSKELLYSEYVGITDAEYAVNLVENKQMKKPNMLFQRSPVAEKVSKLLPALEQSLNELSENPEENNIEVIGGDSFIEMNVAVVKPPDGDADPTSDALVKESGKSCDQFSSDIDDDESDSSETESDLSTSTDESNSDSELNEDLDENILDNEHVRIPPTKKPRITVFENESSTSESE